MASGGVTLPKGFIDWIIELTGEEKPPITIYGDSILIIKPDGIPFDKESVYRLIDQMEQLENKRTKEVTKNE